MAKPLTVMCAWHPKFFGRELHMSGPRADPGDPTVSYGMCRDCVKKTVEEWDLLGSIKATGSENIMDENFRILVLKDNSARYFYSVAKGPEKMLEALREARNSPDTLTVYVFSNDWKLIFREAGADNPEWN